MTDKQKIEMLVKACQSVELKLLQSQITPYDNKAIMIGEIGKAIKQGKEE